MAKSKYTDAICVVIILLMLAVTLLFHYGEELGVEKVERSSHGSVSYSAVIALADGESAIHGSGAYQNGKAVVIAHGGEYTVTGALSDGQLIVEAEGNAEVRLILDGADVFCADGAALWVKNAGDTVISLSPGSKNRLVSGAAFSAEALALDAEGALHSEDDLLIRGEGSLLVDNAYSHAIVCKDALQIDGGSFDIRAVGHGIRGRDSVEICGGSFAIAAEKDGIQSNNDQDAALGTVTIRSGSFDIAAGQDAIQAETALRISGGDFRLKSGKGCQETSAAPGALVWGGADVSLSDSAKGLKAGTDLYIGGGTFLLDCEDDAIHCGGALLVEGGRFEIGSGDDALHADTSLTIVGGSIVIRDAQEGLEAPLLSIEGGEVDITCKNDGLNANGDGEASLRISGGVLRVCCQADGLDSNGDIWITGGEVYVSAQPSDGNSALDYAAENGGQGFVHGGVLVACGFGGMAESFSAESEQCSLLFHLEETVPGGEELILTDSSGAELLRYAPGQDYNAVLLSCAELQLGEEYTLRAADEKYSVELTEQSTVYGSGGFGHGMRPGGMGFPGGMMPPDGQQKTGDMERPEGMMPPGGMEPPPQKP